MNWSGQNGRTLLHPDFRIYIMVRGKVTQRLTTTDPPANSCWPCTPSGNRSHRPNNHLNQSRRLHYTSISQFRDGFFDGLGPRKSDTFDFYYRRHRKNRWLRDNSNHERQRSNGLYCLLHRKKRSSSSVQRALGIEIILNCWESTSL
jgi:hypothetical protein